MNSEHPANSETLGPCRDSRSDEELLALAGAGDPEAFDRLHERLAADVVRSASRILRDREAARDVSQEVFLRLWRLAPRYAPTAPLRALALRLATWKSLNLLRRRRTEEAFGAGWRPLAAGNGDGRQDVTGAIERLPEEQRTAIRKRFFEGKSCREIAVETGVPVGTVKTRLFHGLRRLRDLVRKEE